MVRPERRRPGDIAASVLIVVGLAVGGTLLWRGSDAAGTDSILADPAVTAPPDADAVPAAFVEAWRAPSPVTAAPVVADPAVVTADGGAVIGRDGATGAERWRYARDVPLCAVDAGFPSADDGVGRVLAVHADDRPPGGEFCSEMTALRPDTGERAAARNPDVALGTHLLAAQTLVALTGPDYLEVVRSDLVKTLEYGAVRAPAQPGRQPRSGCTFTSFALHPERLGVVERCPTEETDRLTVLDPDGDEGAERPVEEFSVPLPRTGAALVALSAERAAVALPGPPRLQLLDSGGGATETIPLDPGDADLSRSGGVAAVTADSERRYWWSGTRTLALDRTDLAPVWSIPGALGPAVAYADRLLVPVPAGLLVVDPQDGEPVTTVPVARADADAPVRIAVLGEMLLEQRGDELVALRPG